MLAFFIQSTEPTRKSGRLAHPTEDSKLPPKLSVSRTQDELLFPRRPCRDTAPSKPTKFPAQGTFAVSTFTESATAPELEPSAEGSLDAPALSSGADFVS